MIPMVDLQTQYRQLKSEIDDGIGKALADCRFILGPNVQAFEEEIADYLGIKHAVSCASGTDALHLALLAAGIGAGDEVITSAFTFIATAEAIKYVGAVPVFVDIDPKTFNIDPAEVSKAITDKTKAILPVHLFGQPADLSALQRIADKHNLLIVEDCAQSFGATYNGRMTGSFGISGCFSFFPSKNLGCYGDGGLISCNSDEIAERLKVYRNHGSRERYYHDVIGYNSRLDELQAVVLRIKLKYIDRFNEQRYRTAQQYNEDLAKTGVITPYEAEAGRHVYHQYTILFPDNVDREAVMKRLNADGIACAVYYPVPLHLQNAFRDACADVRLPITERTAQRCLSLPIFPEMTETQVQRVCRSIGQALDVA